MKPLDDIAVGDCVIIHRDEESRPHLGYPLGMGYLLSDEIEKDLYMKVETKTRRFVGVVLSYDHPYILVDGQRGKAVHDLRESKIDVLQDHMSGHISKHIRSHSSRKSSSTSGPFNWLLWLAIACSLASIGLLLMN